MRREAPLIAFGAALAIASVLITGGPEAAAEARRDQARADDLRALVSADECRTQIAKDCGDARDYDPLTGRKYEKRESPARWCAVMERPKERPYGVTAEGCVLVGPRTP